MRDAALRVSSMGRNDTWFTWVTPIDALKCSNLKPQNTGASLIVESTKAKCVFIPNPSCLYRAVSDQDDPLVIYHRSFTLNHFPV